MKFDPTRVAVVDRDADGVLVRGMDPVVSGAFDYKSLEAALVAVGADPTGKKLVVVNIIDNAGERWAWGPEMPTPPPQDACSIPVEVVRVGSGGGGGLRSPRPRPLQSP